MSLSDFQKQKLSYFYVFFYDANKDGVIDWADFELSIKKISEANSWAVGSEQHKKGMQICKTVWEGLQKYADKNKRINDNEISKDEWFQMWAECLATYKSSKQLPEWQVTYMNFFFDASDTSGDGVIDADEYSAVYQLFGLSKDECNKAFSVLSKGNTVNLSRDDFKRLWTEFIVSDDKAAVGNNLFGVAAIQ